MSGAEPQRGPEAPLVVDQGGETESCLSIFNFRAKGGGAKLKDLNDNSPGI